MPRPGCFIPEKIQYPFYKRLGGPQGRSGRVPQYPCRVILIANVSAEGLYVEIMATGTVD